jgi:hypothetical protein
MLTSTYRTRISCACRKFIQSLNKLGACLNIGKTVFELLLKEMDKEHKYAAA